MKPDRCRWAVLLHKNIGLLFTYEFSVRNYLWYQLTPCSCISDLSRNSCSYVWFLYGDRTDWEISPHIHSVLERKKKVSRPLVSHSSCYFDNDIFRKDRWIVNAYSFFKEGIRVEKQYKDVEGGGRREGESNILTLTVSIQDQRYMFISTRMLIV